jgi:hypothetical protein
VRRIRLGQPSPSPSGDPQERVECQT